MISFNKNDIKLENIDINNDEVKKGIVRGAFLGGGSITDPKSRYHLEIRFESNEAREKIIKIINSFNIEVKTLNRKYSYSIYIKDGEEISKVLALIGASGSVLKYETLEC